MASKLTIRKLALIVASTAVAGAIHSGAQAAGEVDCNSTLTQLAIMSEQGEGGIPGFYDHCVSGTRAASPAFTTKGASERAGVAGRSASPGVAGRSARYDEGFATND